MATVDNGKDLGLDLAPVGKWSTDSSSMSSSLDKAQRIARFAEATSVYSPVETLKMPFSEMRKVGQPQPGDVGFGYINDGSNRECAAMPKTPRSPLKSALRVPGTPGRGPGRGLANPLSPTFLEEQALDSKEASTEKEQARDLRVKTRVRMAKLALRGVSFSCSLIILAMISSSLAIFNATRSLPALNGLPAWANTSQTWPQYVVLSCASLSLLITVIIFIGYCRGGHKRAEKVGVYYTLFAVGWFILNMIMWAAAAGILQFAKSNGNNQDIWGWSCVQNHRAELFAQKVDYALVCRLQNWGLICMIIEIMLETISIALYSVIFYRYWSKRKLHKSMDMRDKARSDLYLAQLRSQSAPNTPGFGPKSPTFSQHALSPRFPPAAYKSLGDMDEAASPFTPGGNGLVVPPSAFSTPQPQQQPAFRLQAPPTKANKANRATPALGPAGEVQPPMSSSSAPGLAHHAPMMDGEQQYDAVPIPGAYAGQAVKNPPPIKTSFH